MSESIYRLEHVSKIYQDRNTSTTALDDISLEIHEGEIFGIIGMSGAGKSTLVRTLNRLEEVSSGEVFFDGRALGALKPKEMRMARKSIAMIFQSFNLLTQKTVIANVELPLKLSGIPAKQRRNTAMEMLRIVGLEDKAKAFPMQLSGGQRQRVAIARALAMQPRVLLCDEATSALDPKITEEILALLQDINRRMNLTIVIITHEMSVIEKICDRVAIIDLGQLAEIGAVKDIFSNPQSTAAKKLVLPGLTGDNPFDMTDRRCFRIVFDGRESTEPVIANLVQETGERVNILSANTRSVGGIGFGQMIIELPTELTAQEKVLRYFEKIGMSVTEIEQEVIA